MGKLVYGMSVSLDGFVETPSRSLDWVQVDEELHAVFNDQAREVSASICGRRMDELMTAYWPTAESDPSATPAMLELARIWNDMPKIVFSRTLTSVGWNSRLVRDDPVEEVRRLKAQPGFDMDVGGPTIAAPLIRAGLVDEYRSFLHPVILGAGNPFFAALDAPNRAAPGRESAVRQRGRIPAVRSGPLASAPGDAHVADGVHGPRQAVVSAAWPAEIDSLPGGPGSKSGRETTWTIGASHVM